MKCNIHIRRQGSHDVERFPVGAENTFIQIVGLLWKQKCTRNVLGKMHMSILTTTAYINYLLLLLPVIHMNTYIRCKIAVHKDKVD